MLIQSPPWAWQSELSTTLRINCKAPPVTHRVWHSAILFTSPTLPQLPPPLPRQPANGFWDTPSLPHRPHGPYLPGLAYSHSISLFLPNSSSSSIFLDTLPPPSPLLFSVALNVICGHVICLFSYYLTCNLPTHLHSSVYSCFLPWRQEEGLFGLQPSVHNRS